MTDAVAEMTSVGAACEGATPGGQPVIRNHAAISRKIEVLEPEPENEAPAASADAGGLSNDLDQTPETFTFNHVEEFKSIFEADMETREKMTQWGMSELMQVHCFRYDQYYKKYMSDKLLLDFVRDPVVQSVFKVPLKGKANAEKGPQPLGDVTKIRAVPVPTKLTSFGVFDRLGEQGVGVVKGEGGHIQKCFDNFIEDLQIADKLRELLVDEDSENYTVYTDDERDELLMRVFKHCVLGGGMCQYEDVVTPYFAVTKTLYKGLLAARKHEETKEVEILTEVYALKSVRASDRSAPPLFPSKSPYSFCYLFVNPVKRTVMVWYMPWVGMLG